MKKYLANLIALVMVLATVALTAAPASAQHAVTNQKFQKVVHLCGLATGSGSFSGRNYSNCKGFADSDLYAIEANTVIEKVYVIIDTAITGTSALTVGDDDAATGYATSGGITLGTPGMYAWAAGTGGAYTYVVGADGLKSPGAKYYSAAGKEIKLDITTANTAGKARVVIEGYKIPAP